MKIVKAYPPNWWKIRAAFKQAVRPGAIFCYGDTIYNPIGTKLSDALIAHEEVHSRQQGNNPAAWWDRYILEPQFRFEQELEAHRAEYLVAMSGGSRQARRSILRDLSARLASPFYGCCVSRERAAQMIHDGGAA